MNAAVVRNEVLRWIGAIVAVFVIAVVLYLGALFSVYLLGWIVELIGIIFT